MPRNTEDRNPVRNRSESTVPNGSELPLGHPHKLSANNPNGRPDALGGRPPVLNDDELYSVAEALNRHLGRPPRLQELVEQSGGCQRQRASRAIQRLRHTQAEMAVRSQLVLSQELEAELRSWIERWMRVAAKQLSESQARMEEDHEHNMLRNQDLLAEQHEAISQLREQLEDQRRIATELLVRNRQLGDEVQTVRAEHTITQAVSDERYRLLQALRVREVKENRAESDL